MIPPDTEDNYPAPVPTSTCNSDVFDERIYIKASARGELKLSGISNITLAPADLNVSFEKLLSYLMTDVSSEVEKVMVIFSWFTKQNYNDPSPDVDEDDTTPAGFLHLIALKKRTLSQLFAVLCRKAGLKCTIIHGYCKETADSGDMPPTPTVNSDWTAVYVNGEWRFVHVELALPYSEWYEDFNIKIETDGKAVRQRNACIRHRTDLTYIFTDPINFIRVCRPENDIWQLLTDPWDWQEFCDVSPTTNIPFPRGEDIESLFVTDEEEHYPEPFPPTKRKEDIFKLFDFKAIDERARNAPIKAFLTYDNLFEYLFVGLTSDIQKVRAIFSWFAINWTIYISKMISVYMVENIDDPNTPIGAMKLTRSIYPQQLLQEEFFTVVCRQAGIPCVMIRGSWKQKHTYALGKTCTLMEKVWNAVFVDGNWHLINTRGVLGDITYWEIDEGQICWQVFENGSEFYFMANPDEMVHLCLPKDPRWQLLEQPVSKEEFFNEPWYHTAYFLSPWQMKEGYGATIFAENGESQIEFNRTTDDYTVFSYDLYFNELASQCEFPKEMQIKRYITLSNTPKSCAIITLLPINGVYPLQVKSTDGTVLCEFWLISYGIVNEQQPFPDRPENGFGVCQEAEKAGLSMASCEDGIVNVQPGEKVYFGFKFLRNANVKKSTSAEDGEIPTKSENTVEKALGACAAMTQDYEAVIAGLQSATSGDLVCIQVTSTGNEDEVRVIVKYPDNDKHLALKIYARNLKEKEQSTNVTNYLLTTISRFKGFDGSIHNLKRSEEKRNLEEIIKTDGKEQMENQYKLMQLYKQEFEEAIDFNDVKDLEAAIDSASRSRLAYYIHRTSWYKEAEALYRNLRRQSLVTIKIEELSVKDVEGVLSYNHPNNHIHTVMKATFLLLGEKRKKLKKWKNIQNLLRSRHMVIKRAQNCDGGHVSTKCLQKVSELLDTFNLDAIKTASPHAAAFYLWCKSILEQATTNSLEGKSDIVEDELEYEQD